MMDGNDTNRDEAILDGLEDGAGAPEATRCDYDPLEDDLADMPQRPRRDDLMELPDDPPGTVYRVCYGDPPPGWDESDDVAPPSLLDDSDAEDCDIEGLAPPLSHMGSGYAWDSERECPYRTDADERDRHED